jgi:hypothetical protein
MAVIIQEEKIIEGKKYNVKVYKTTRGKLVTDEDKKKAEKLDAILANKMKQIEKEMENEGLLCIKGKKGRVLELWFEVGKRLDFVMDTSIIAAEDREFVWRALYDHAGKLAPGPLTERAKRDPATSHFSYCYKLARFDWTFINMAGDWTSWSEFFDRKETKNDQRIIEWLGKKCIENNIASRQNWLRPLTKMIHSEFENKDTTIFSVEELNYKLDKIQNEIKEDKELER